MGDGDPVLSEDDAWREVYLALTSGFLLSDSGAGGYSGVTRTRRFVTSDGARVRIDAESGGSGTVLAWTVELWNQEVAWSKRGGYTSRAV